MNKISKSEMPIFITMLCAVVSALIIKIFRVNNTTYPILSAFSSFYVCIAFVGTFFVWAMSIKKRVVHRLTRIGIITIAFLMILCFITRTIKYNFVTSEYATRMLWYSYYIPFIGIPTITYIISNRVDDYEGTKLQFKDTMPIIIAIMLILFFITNDKHQLSFKFTSVDFNDSDYKYNVMYYIAAAWIGLCLILSFKNFIQKSLQFSNKKLIVYPILPIALLSVFLLCYSLDLLQQNFRSFLIEAVCITIIVDFEMLFTIGLIKVNSRYNDLFNASVNLSAKIVDKEYNVKFSSANTLPLTKNQMLASESSNIMISDSIELKSKAIKGGRIIWVEDISEIISLRNELLELKNELEDRNKLLKLQYEKEKERTSIEEQNKLYDMLQFSTQKEIDDISLLSKEYGKCKDSDQKHFLLCKIAVLCSIIKRKKHLVLSAYNNKKIELSELESAVEEVIKTLKVLDIRCNKFFDIKNISLPSETVNQFFNLFETCVEESFEGIKSILVSLSYIDEKIRFSINIVCDNDMSIINEQYPNANICFDEEDGYFISISIDDKEVIADD